MNISALTSEIDQPGSFVVGRFLAACTIDPEIPMSVMEQLHIVSLISVVFGVIYTSLFPFFHNKSSWNLHCYCCHSPFLSELQIGYIFHNYGLFARQRRTSCISSIRMCVSTVQRLFTGNATINCTFSTSRETSLLLSITGQSLNTQYVFPAYKMRGKIGTKLLPQAARESVLQQGSVF